MRSQSKRKGLKLRRERRVQEKNSSVTSVFLVISKINGDGDSTGQSGDDNEVRKRDVKEQSEKATDSLITDQFSLALIVAENGIFFFFFVRNDSEDGR